MTKPASLEHGAAFELAAELRDIRHEPAYQRTGHTARTLVRVADMRVILIALRAGSHLAEHHAEETASIHVLSGQVRLNLPDRIVELGTGELLVLGRGIRHDVGAAVDSALLLTLGWPGPP